MNPLNLSRGVQVGPILPWEYYLGFTPSPYPRPSHPRIPAHAALSHPDNKTLDSQGPSVCSVPRAPPPARVMATRATAVAGPAFFSRGGRGLPTFRRMIVAAPCSIRQGRPLQLEHDTAAREVLERIGRASTDGLQSPWQGILA